MIPVVDMKSFEERLEIQATQANLVGRKTFYADVVFARPDTDLGQELLGSLQALDELSGDERHFYFPGYGRGRIPPNAGDAKRCTPTDWWFSDMGFTRLTLSLKVHYPNLQIYSGSSFAVLEIRTSDDSSLFKPILGQQFLGNGADLRNLITEVDHSKRNHGVLERKAVRWGVVPDKAGPAFLGAAIGTFLRSVVTGDAGG